METHPEQFPDESRPEPSCRTENRVFDAIQGSDHAGFANQRGAARTPRRRKWTSPYGYRAWAASASRSRAASSHRRGASGNWKP